MKPNGIFIRGRQDAHQEPKDKDIKKATYLIKWKAMKSYETQGQYERSHALGINDTSINDKTNINR